MLFPSPAPNNRAKDARGWMERIPLMPSKASLVLFLGLTTFPVATWGGYSVTIPVSEDETVNSGDPARNFSRTFVRGGLYSGVDGALSGASRFYLKFNLPEVPPGTKVARADLLGYYNDDFNDSDDSQHHVYFVASDLWSEHTLTWANQPGNIFGTPEASFDPASVPPGNWVGFDMTSIVQQEIDGDGVLSLLFRAGDESLSPLNQNWEYFAERESDPDRAFRLQVSMVLPPGSAGAGIAAPLPPAVLPGLIVLGAMGAHRWISRRRSSGQR